MMQTHPLHIGQNAISETRTTGSGRVCSSAEVQDHEVHPSQKRSRANRSNSAHRATN